MGQAGTALVEFVWHSGAAVGMDFAQDK